MEEEGDRATEVAASRAGAGKGAGEHKREDNTGGLAGARAGPSGWIAEKEGWCAVWWFTRRVRRRGKRRAVVGGDGKGVMGSWPGSGGRREGVERCCRVAGCGLPADGVDGVPVERSGGFLLLPRGKRKEWAGGG